MGEKRKGKEVNGNGRKKGGKKRKGCGCAI